MKLTILITCLPVVASTLYAQAPAKRHSKTAWRTAPMHSQSSTASSAAGVRLFSRTRSRMPISCCLAKTTYPARFHVWPPPFAMLWDRAAASRPWHSKRAAPDRRAKMADLQTRYPYGVAFLHVRDENDLAAHCAAVLQSEDFRIWGFDQEFVGSAGWIIERMLAAHPGPEARAAILKYRQWNARMPQRHSAPATLPSCSCLPCPPRSLRAPAPRIARMPAPALNCAASFRNLRRVACRRFCGSMWPPFDHKDGMRGGEC